VCPAAHAREVAVQIRDIKRLHAVSPRNEIKWQGVSPSRLVYYRALVSYFMQREDLSFRAVVADKRQLRHDEFGQSHDDWYYKMYFQLLNVLIDDRSDGVRIFLDIKDTRGAEKVARLQDVLCNSRYDFDRTVIQQIQTVRSHEVEPIQLADLLTGLVGYATWGLQTSAAKLDLVSHMRALSGRVLTKSTFLGDRKVNIFHWKGREVGA
jgi:hypothetical protein